jgi:hypothetical protein
MRVREGRRGLGRSKVREGLLLSSLTMRMSDGMHA